MNTSPTRPLLLSAAIFAMIIAPPVCAFADGPCDGAYYTHAELDNRYFLDSLRRDPGNSSSWTVDDLSVSREATLTRIYWKAAEWYESFPPSDAEVIVLANESGRPGAVITLVSASIQREITGEGRDGYEFVNYSSDVQIELPPGDYFLGVRSLSTLFSGSSIRAARPVGLGAFQFQSWRGVWDPWSDELGFDVDAAICIFADLRGSATGACCVGLDCARATASECADRGGEYLGDDSNCYPNRCPGHPGACCLGPGACGITSAEECEALGGQFDGPGSQCSSLNCPIDGACDNAVFTTGEVDGRGGLHCSRHTHYDQIYEAADDFTVFSESTRITSVRWYSLGFDSSEMPAADIVIYKADGPGLTPGTEVFRANDAVAFRMSMDSGKLYQPLVFYQVGDLDLTLPAGTYFLSAMPVLSSSRGGQSMSWATAAPSGLSAVRRDQGDWQNFPDWTPAIEDYPYVDADLAFCLGGESNGAIGGACCLDGICSLVTSERCANRGGQYGGDRTTCAPNPCPGAVGACCFQDASCQEIAALACDEAEGTFYGEGSACTSGRCPLLSDCDNSIYDQSAFDGRGSFVSLSSTMGSNHYYSTFTADDFELRERTDITAFHWFTADSAAHVEFDGYADVRVYGYNESGDRPGAEVASTLRRPLTRRVSNGDYIDGYALHLNSLKVSLALPPGKYFLSLALTGYGSYGSGWVTTAVRGAVAQGRGQYAEPDWSPWSRRYGFDADVSFCIEGAPRSAGVGACCVKDVCTLMSSANCTSKRGTYLGDDTPCYPTPCGERLRACCFDSGVCELLTADACTSSGGTPYEASGECFAGLCPRPPCEPSIVNNGPRVDGFGMSSVRSRSGLDTSSIDDFELTTSATISAITWQTMIGGQSQLDGTYDLLIAIDDAGRPGRDIVHQKIRPVSLDTGEFDPNLGWYHIFEHRHGDLSLRLPAGRYWLGLQRVVSGWDEPYELWLRAEGSGYGAMVRSPRENLPDWTPWSEYFRVPSNALFCIAGDASDQPFGACCRDGVCTLLTTAECADLGGNYSGDETGCIPNACPGAPGACCLTLGNCEFLLPADCESAGGEFQGNDVLCAIGLCPVPNACTDSFYDSSAYDGTYDYGFGRHSDNPGDGEYLIDDVTLENDTEITAIHWLSLDPDDVSITAADVIVFTSNGRNPTEMLAELRDLPIIRVVTADTFLDQLITVNHVSGLTLRLTRGTYYIGGHSVGDDYPYTIPLIGPATGDSARSFGDINFEYCEPFCSLEWLIGRSANFAMCIDGRPAIIRGDSNCDGSIDFLDIDCFIAALSGEWKKSECASGDDCRFEAANDINIDGRVNFDDIDDFIDCLIEGRCP